MGKDVRPAGRLALFLSSLGGGGVQRVMFNLACALAARGYHIDLVVARAEGPYLDQVPASVRIVPLRKMRRLTGLWQALTADYERFETLLTPVLRTGMLPKRLGYLPDLVRYLHREQPAVVLSAGKTNLVALWARQLAGGSTRLVISQHMNLTLSLQKAAKREKWLQTPLIRSFYPWADGIVAVSNGVADDLSLAAGIPRERIATIYNPVVTPDLQEKAHAPLDHPWFALGSPPVLLGAGRLVMQKDFPTLLKAFARVRAAWEARLIILGEGKERTKLEALARKLGVAADVALPSFANNPFAFMARAAVFVLSSAWEGLPGVLIEAMACGCPVVSTDCPSGPAEILDGGAYGPLVPVGDDAALAQAILSVLDTPPDPGRLRARAAMFSVDSAADRYLEVLTAQSI